MKRLAVIAVVFAVMLTLGGSMPASAVAATFRSGNTVVVGPGETINDDLYATGSTVQILGNVNGSVFAAGQNVEVSGTVSEGVFAAGQNVTLSGTDESSVHLAGMSVLVSSKVTNDVMAAGEVVHVTPEASVGRDAVLAGSAVTLGADVGRDTTMAATDVTLGGAISNNAFVTANTFRMLPGSEVDGDLTYTADSTELQGTVAGQSTVVPRPERPERAPKPPREGSGGGFGVLLFLGFVYWIRALIGYVIFGLIVVFAFRRFSGESADVLSRRYWESLGWGALAVFAFPFVFFPALFMGILVGGWWIAVLALFAWFTLLALGLIVGALCLGRLIVSRGQNKPHDVWPMLLGLVILWVVWLVPFFGGLVVFVTMVFGVGGVVLAIVERRAEQRLSEEHAQEPGIPVGMAPPHAEPPVERPADLPPEAPNP